MLTVVVVGQVLGGQLGNRVRPARFTHGAKARDVSLAHTKGIRSEYLTRGEVDEALDATGGVRGLERVHRALQRHFHREHGVLAHGVDARDRRHVYDVIGALHHRAHGLLVAHVADHQLEIRVLVEPGFLERVSTQIVEDPHTIVFDQPARERRADEPCAAGDEDSRPVKHDDFTISESSRSDSTVAHLAFTSRGGTWNARSCAAGPHTTR
jgi:hypothetical protein